VSDNANRENFFWADDTILSVSLNLNRHLSGHRKHGSKPIKPNKSTSYNKTKYLKKI